MGVPFQQRKLVREEIPTFEKFVGLGVLLFLIAVASWVYFQRDQFAPETYALNPLSLDSTRAAVAGGRSTLAGESESPEGAPGNIEGAPGLNRRLPAFAGQFEAMGATEHYNPDTLYEKINGRAPAYLEFNFQELTTRSFSIDGLPGQYIDVFVFWMDTPLNAFGIFSLEREALAQLVDFAADGYRSEMGYFFRVGRAYVQIIASSTDDTVMESARTYASALAAELPKNISGLEARMRLPVTGQISGTLTYLQSNAYGHASLKNVFEAKYWYEGLSLTYFAKQAESVAEARVIWDELSGFYGKYGEIKSRREIAGAEVLEADNFGQTTLIAIRKKVISGVINAEQVAPARSFLEAVLQDALPEIEIPASVTHPEASSTENEDYGYE